MTELSRKIEEHLPCLRRYARAMTGSRARGDQLAEATLMSILEDPEQIGESVDTRISLFHVLQDTWGPGQGTVLNDLSDIEAGAQRHLSRLTPGSRDALLLRAFEHFSDEEIGCIMRRAPKEVADLVRVARLDIFQATAGSILVIEDEAAIASNIEDIVTGMGHSVIGIAANKQDALHLARHQEPDLILSDIQLANNSSGIDAVEEILTEYPKKPVIFITGFPELLLTGRGPEPAFLIAKPFSEEQVRSAVSQAMFFAPAKSLA